jgi:hypothetical protein
MDNTYSHLTEPTVIAALKGDVSSFNEARQITFRSWWDDNNEGEQIASSLSDFEYKKREQAILAMGEEDEPIPFTFLDALRRYWL